MKKENLLDDIITSDKKDIVKLENETLRILLDEIDLIKDDGINSFVRSILLKAESFWIIPSSFLEDGNPPDERATGGNVLHTKRTARIAKLMCKSYAMAEDETDIVIAACLLHDLTKGIMLQDGEQYNYDPMHPYTVGTFVSEIQKFDKEHGDDSSSSSLFIEEEAMQTILRLIRCHLGPWSPIPETYPITYMDYIVHMADHIAANLHLVIEGSELLNDKWTREKE